MNVRVDDLSEFDFRTANLVGADLSRTHGDPKGKEANLTGLSETQASEGPLVSGREVAFAASLHAS
jgi:uncharacterized protein YjbI with pentapeptide repeats